MVNINCCPIRKFTTDDYLVIFGDEAQYPSAAGVSGYVYYEGDLKDTPNNEWYEDMDFFKALINNNSIDINKILIFHVYSAVGSIDALYPTVNVLPGYEMPISQNNIISPTPRNADPNRLPPVNIERPLPGGQTLTGQWIFDKITEKLNPVIKQPTFRRKTRIVIFVDDSPSLGFGSVAPGINNFIELASNNFDILLIECKTERWLRWIVNTFAGIPVCS